MEVEEVPIGLAAPQHFVGGLSHFTAALRQSLTMSRGTLHEMMQIITATGCSTQCCFLSEILVQYIGNLFHGKSHARVFIGARLALCERKEYFLPL